MKYHTYGYYFLESNPAKVRCIEGTVNAPDEERAFDKALKKLYSNIVDVDGREWRLTNWIVRRSEA